VHRTWQGTCHASPRMRMFSFELQERPNADADRNHAADELLNGAHAMEGTARLRRKQAGLPSASTASATWPGENRRVRRCTALSPAARPSSRRARERAMALGRRRKKPRAARRSMKRATPDETTELSSARRGGATECGAAAEGVVSAVGPFVRRLVWGPRAGVGIRGRTQRTFARWGLVLG
jgi:hypothetical protein